MTALALILMLAAGQPGGTPARAGEPSDTAGTVTVTAHHTPEVTVTAAQPCPEPQPGRYPATSDPRVIDSFPHQGASAAPGLAQVRVTFDAPMSCYAEVTSEGGEQDPCEPRGAWSLPDRRSFLLRCRLAPGVSYVFKFRRDEGRGFVGLSGRDAEPFDLRFTTAADAPPVAAWPQAEAADPGPVGAVPARSYVTCADVSRHDRSNDCSRQRFDTVAPPPP